MELNAGLQIMVVPLKTSTPDGSYGVPIAANEIPTGGGPFLPDRVPDSGSAVGGGLTLVATATVPVANSTELLWFGHSQGTMDDDPEEPLWCGTASTCISLWRTIHGLTITLERLASLDEHLQMVDVYSGEPFAGLEGLTAAVDQILEGTGLTADSTIQELLTGGPRLHPGLSHSTLLTQCIESPQSYRNTRLIEGLLVRVEPDASRQVDDLIVVDDDFDRNDAWQSLSIPWKWNAVALVDEPVETDAKIAVREDGRSVLLNLEAMSVYHDYDGHGGRHLVVACIPEVARVGAIADSCSTISSMLVDGAADPAEVSRDGLKRLEHFRDIAEASRRRHAVAAFERRFVVPEKFKTWTHGDLLVPILWEPIESRVTAMDDELRVMTSLVTKIIDSDIQRTTTRLQAIEEERANRRLARVAYESGAIGIGAVALLVGLFMTIAAAPAWDGVGNVDMWPWSFVIVAATVGVGVGAGWVFRKIRDWKP